MSNTRSKKTNTPRAAKFSLRRFIRNEDGSSTLEAVIWMPVFVIVLAVVMNISLVFFQESQMLRVAHDANRAFSLGRMGGTDDAETYVKTNLAYLDSDQLVVNSVYDSGYVTTQIQVPAIDLMPMSFMKSAFNDVIITVSSTQIVEF